MSDYIIDGDDRIYNIWQADHSKRLYRNELLRHHHLQRLLLKSGDFHSLLDIGCGTGYFDYLLAQNGKKIKAVDLSAKRLSLFADIARKFNIQQLNADLFKLEESGFDALISQEVLEHLQDYEAALSKMKSFLKPDGIALFCVPYNENLNAKTVIDPQTQKKHHTSGHLHSFTKEKLSGSAAKIGFEVLGVHLIVNKRSVKHFTRLRLPINSVTSFFDRLMNQLFPHKAAYLAVLCRNKA
ncbi:MAG: class I SAM-dependent methyltransferase [Deferribacteres bacterium]|nr:class I SAM-dependent methyltransferase [candidate division KSB1 bacterium]MCB9504371.1 class I SAM-dependent methyltransferase [Deferribacteres bacterium]